MRNPSRTTRASVYKKKGGSHQAIPTPRFSYQTTEQQTEPTHARILSWNINSLRNKTQKKIYINAIRPFAACLIEPRRTMDISGFQATHSLPADGVNKKVNCSILVDNSIPFILKTRAINYISITLPNKPFNKPTLLICLYRNPL